MHKHKLSEFLQIDCPLCSGNNYTKLSHKGQFGIPTYVVICKTCGLVYLNPRWSDERYRKFYSDEYDKYYRPQILSQSANVKYKNAS